jgi:DNA-binding SARP family transcriptional activator/class 3 adenylate cyclase/tetratricopeptide (TPR) repeat protein
MAGGLRLFLFGSPRIELVGQPVKIETRKSLALLAYLGLMRESYRRDSLVNLFWPEYDMAHGRAVLRRTLSALNTALPAGSLVTDRETIGLDPSLELWLDVHEFLRLLASSRMHPHSESDVCPDCQVLLSEAVAIYRDDFMSGFSLADSYNFDDWQFFQAESLRQELGMALEKVVNCLILGNALEQAIVHARRWLSLDRLNESAHCRLMLLYAWSNQRSAALRQYQGCKEALQSQLGVSPQDSTTDLYRAIEMGRAPAMPIDPQWQVFRGQEREGPQTPQNQTAGQDLTARPTSQTIHQRSQPEQNGAPSPINEKMTREEKRIVTILVFDICRSQGMANPHAVGEDFLEEQARQVRDFLDLAGPVLQKYGGTIERGLGGSLLVVFGLSQAHENDPELALRAALELRDKAQRAALCVGAAVVTGQAYVKPSDNREPWSQNLVGEPVDLSIRLAGQIQPGQILCSESTYQLTRRAFSFKPFSLDSMRPGEPVIVYQVERLLPVPRKARGLESLNTGMIGRNRELAHLLSCLDDVLAGQGWLVSLIGEAGVGKSRLVEEFKTAIFLGSVHPGSNLPADKSQSSILWLEGRCLEADVTVSYWPFLDMFKEYFARSGKEEQQSIRSTLQRLVGMGFLARERVEEMALLFDRLLSIIPEEGISSLPGSWSPEAVRQQTFLAIRDFLLALSQEQPLVIVFEDLHWADGLSFDLLTFLLDALPLGRLLLVCVYRPDQEYRTHHLSNIADRKCRNRFSQILLRELLLQESHDLVDSLLGHDRLSMRLKDLIWERCQGNPFYIEEVIQSLMDAGLIYQEQGAWQSPAELDSTLVPAGIQSVILSRLDHLEEDWKGVLQTAAVIGRVFRKRILQKAISYPLNLDKMLWELEERGLIYQERAIPEEEYSFRHVLMQEAIYYNILRGRRKTLHQGVAEAVEGLNAPNLEEYYEQLAYHYEKSGNIRQTIAYLYRAGEKAIRNASNEVAIALLTKGLELLRSLPETHERNLQELQFLIMLGVPLFHSRGHAAEEVQLNYRQARDLCQKTGDTTQLFAVLLGLRRFALMRGRVQEACVLGSQMLELARSRQDSTGQARAHMMLAEAYLRLGNPQLVIEHAQEGMALSVGQNAQSHINLYGNDTGIGCQVFLANGLWHRGFPDQSRAALQSGLEQLKALEHPFTRSFALFFSTNIFLLLGDRPMVQSLAGEVFQIANGHGFALFQALVAIQLGWLLAEQGQAADGVEKIQGGIADLHRIQVSGFLPEAFAYLSEALALNSKSQESLDAVEQGLAIIEETGERYWEAELYRLRGEILWKTGHTSQAVVAFTHSLTIARSQGSRSWELRAAASLARLLNQEGRKADAYQLLAPVYATFSEGFGTTDLQAAAALLEDLGLWG